MISPVALASQLVRLNTVNPPGRESACARLLTPMLQDCGFAVDHVVLSEGRESLIASIGGSAHARALCFTGHFDTVPLGTAPWSVDPHGGEVRGSRLYGRGASDMKAGIAAFIAAASGHSRSLRSGPGVMMVLTAAEETGCQGAMQLASVPMPLKVGSLIVGEPTGNCPALGHKGALWLRARFTGRTAHGSMPHLGDNAIYHAVDAIGAARDMPLGDAAHPLLGRASRNIGTISGGQNINSVADRAEFTLDLRTVPPMRNEDLAREVRRQLGSRCEMEELLNVPSMSTPASSAWVRKVFDILEREQGRRPEATGMQYFTDAPVLHRAIGPVDTVILGPGDPAMAHQTDEYCEVQKIEEITRVYLQLIEDWYAQ